MWTNTFIKISYNRQVPIGDCFQNLREPTTNKALTIFKRNYNLHRSHNFNIVILNSTKLC